MRSPFLASTLVALSLSALTGAAHASIGFETTIPNGTCVACHTAEPATNSFGDAVKLIMATPQSTWWPALRGAQNEIDSDNDGQTNGEELGDPCGTWKMGDPTVPRSTDISNPGDPGSTSMSAEIPPCGMGAGGASASTTTGAAATTGASMTAGSGAGAGSPKSTGAGIGDEPATVQTGACASIAPTASGGAVAAAAWLLIAVAMLKRRGPKRR